MGIWADNKSCKLCVLHQFMPCSPVPGFTKNANPDIMIIGEAPGSDEAIIGKAFQGLCGKLLDKMLVEAGVIRDNLYVTNLLKCRTTVNNAGTKNRPPTKDEITACQIWIDKELDLVKPKIVLTLGSLSSQYLLKDKNIKVTQIAGQEFEDTENNRIVVPMLHPSYILQYSRSNVDQFIGILKRLKAKYEFYKW